MIATPIPFSPENRSYLSGYDFDYGPVCDFFAALNGTLALSSEGGGNSDLLEASALVGRYSLNVRLDIGETAPLATFASIPSEVVITIEDDEHDATTVEVIQMPPLNGGTLTDVTTAWLLSVCSYLATQVRVRCLPFQIPAQWGVAVAPPTAGPEWIASDPVI